MTPAAEALARRAVACPRWRWCPGMRVLAYSETRGGWTFSSRLTERCPVPFADTALPDFDDAATVGALLGLVREAWETAGATVELMREFPPAWGYVCCGETCFWSRGEDGWAEALVAALEEAPLEAAP